MLWFLLFREIFYMVESFNKIRIMKVTQKLSLYYLVNDLDIAEILMIEE